MKKCPFCAEQIQDDAIKCRYCGSMLDGSHPAPSSAGRNGAMDLQAKQLLAQGEKIQAIKFIREQTNWGLAQAKAYAEALERGQDPGLPPVQMPPSVPRQGKSPAAGIVWLVVAVAAIVLWILVRRG